MTCNTRHIKNVPEEVHHYGKRRLCLTGGRAPDVDAPKVDPLVLVLGTRGLIPLWDKGVILQYRFNERSLQRSGRTKQEILKLFNKAISQWGDAVPVIFTEN